MLKNCWQPYLPVVEYICWWQLTIILDSSVVEQSAVNRWVVGSSPTRGVLFIFGSLVKRLRRGPLTAETGVRFPYESSLFYKSILWRHSQVAKALDCNSTIPSSNLGVALKILWKYFHRIFCNLIITFVLLM